MYWCIGLFIDVSVCWCIGVLAYWSVHWCTGVLVYWRTDLGFCCLGGGGVFCFVLFGVRAY